MPRVHHGMHRIMCVRCACAQALRVHTSTRKTKSAPDAISRRTSAASPSFAALHSALSAASFAANAAAALSAASFAAFAAATLSAASFAAFAAAAVSSASCG